MPLRSLLDGLNQSQVQAVSHVDGPMLVLAGPGSGKTRVVTHRIAYLIEQGIDPHRILALTFTNKAAQEMKIRLQQLIGDVDSLWMGTFHGFCVRLIRRYARLVGLPENFSIYDTSDAEIALKSAVNNSNFELTHISLGKLANRISYFKNRLVTPEILESEALSSEEHAVRQVYPYYQQELLKNGAVDFDDLLMHTATLLRSNPELRGEWDRRLSHVMVDEYQDTNLAQYVILRHLCVDHPNLAATGDPDQSIYGWRGANAKNVSNLERDYPDLNVVRLEDNYRSTPEILSTADYLIQHNSYRKEKHLLATRDSGRSVRLVIYPSARSEAEEIAEEIATLHEGGASLNDFAILYRTNAHSRLFEHAFMRRQLPFQLIGGYRFYLRKEIKDLVSYLLLVHNPEDDVALQRAINTPARGIGKQTVAKMQDYAASRGLPLLAAARECADHGLLSKRAVSSVRRFLKIFDQLCELVHGPLVDLLETTIELTGYRAHLEKHSQGDGEDSDVLANLDELLAEAHEIDQGLELSPMEEEQSALERFLEFAALQSDTDRLKGGNQVTLMTLHAAKGLEFPNVYIAAVEENILPHSRSKDDPLQLEEERRLFFVGITRAENQLQISYAVRRGFSGQESGVPSSFLLELPKIEMQLIDKTQVYRDGGHDFGGRFEDHDFDQSHESASGDWDEYNQVEEDSSDEGVSVDFDDCQLPPDELAARLKRMPGGSSGGAAKIVSAADLLEKESGSSVRVGCIVQHETLGEGEVISDSGAGKKRSVMIQFFRDASRRSFRLSHVKLDVLREPEF
ncbi:MAG: UvrD-helicase domain-containing protein [Planctomycetota bacterium]